MFEIGLILDLDGRQKDVVVALEDDADGNALYAAVSRITGAGPDRVSLVVRRTGVPIPAASKLEELGLRWGDHLLLRHAPAPASATVPYVLEGIAGPVTRVVIPLGLGEHHVGREERLGGTVLHDPAISRRHARLSVTASGLTVADLGSKNGTWLDGVEVTDEVAVVDGQVLVFGDSEFQVRSRTRALSPHLRYVNGLLRFNRQPRLPDHDPAQEIHLPTPPATPAKRRIPMASAIAPLLMASVMVLWRGELIYLLMAGLSPVVLVFNAVDDRRAGRKKFADDATRFRTELAARSNEFDRAVIDERAWADRRWPDQQTLAPMIQGADPRLWWRRPSDGDFLDLRVGLCDQPSRVAVTYTAGGDDDLDKAARELQARARMLPDAPAVVPLRGVGVLGVVGDKGDVAAHTRWLVGQLAAAHSPRDVAIGVIAPGGQTTWEHMKWLPHTRTLDETRPMLAFTDDDAVAVFRSLRELADARRQAHAEMYGDASQSLPQVIVVVEPPLAVPRRIVSELLTGVRSIGIAVIWLARDRGELPGECEVVVEVPRGDRSGSISHTGAERAAVQTKVESLPEQVFIDWVCDLAPLRDITATAGSGPVPATVNLLDLLDATAIDSEIIKRRWAAAGDPIVAVMGKEGDGTASVDLERDGPHGLIAGMTGSGKSEFLQSLVASLAMSYPPSRVNFVLIDYKGGSAFSSCKNLPHTVGYVTDLDGHLAERALRSLEAELSYRERTITVVGGAKDLVEFRKRKPHEAPPSLVIVIDEFAFLKKEVPEFVDRLIDVAQRGRSLGVHLLLATQRPHGIVSEDIRGNANLRVALRVNSPEDSREVIDRPDAVTISKATPGRAMVKTGHGAVRVMQSAYVGANSAVVPDTSPQLAHTFHPSPAELRALSLARDQGASDEVTDLDRIVAAVQSAVTELRLAAPRRPWVEPLPDHLALDLAAATTPTNGLAATIGLADLPAQQAQRPWALDLQITPNVVIYGGPGSGKTTLLRTLAVALALQLPPSALHLYAIDFGQDGLLPLAGLPHWGGTAGPADLAKLHRLIDLLDELMAERRQQLGEAAAASAGEFRRGSGQPMAEVVVLVDNLAAVISQMDSLTNQAYLTRLYRLAADGRAAGLHFVITADRAGAVPGVLAAAASGQLVLSLANPADYVSLGLAKLAKIEGVARGRAFDRGGTEIQIAMVSGDSTRPELEQLQAAVRRIREHSQPFPVPPLRLLPDHVTLAGLGHSSSLAAVPLGIDERFRTVTVDLLGDPRFLVVGPPRSGRSTVLATLVGGIRSAAPGLSCYLLGTRRTPLSALGGWTLAATEIGAVTNVLAQLAELVRARAGAAPAEPLLVVIDDGDELVEAGVGPGGQIDQLQKTAADANVVLLAAVTTFKAQRTYSSWLGPMRTNRRGLLLAGDSGSADVFDSRLPHKAATEVPPGRGVLFRPSGAVHLQVATASE